MTLIDLTLNTVIDLTLIDVIDNDNNDEASQIIQEKTSKNTSKNSSRRVSDRASECSICYESMSKGKRKLITLGCRHVYHTMCLKKWAKRRCTCPMDRIAFNPNVLQNKRKRAINN